MKTVTFLVVPLLAASLVCAHGPHHRPRGPYYEPAPAPTTVVVVVETEAAPEPPPPPPPEPEPEPAPRHSHADNSDAKLVIGLAAGVLLGIGLSH
jgi:hypothetical protein